ncbi:MFS transporter [Halonatronum saccharophilum]|uniref:MFS transporter n=1 Tax=Halonatronum saccharophilum TaxID=150060 RepID=UPI000486E483|nr:MFS transporter [Halonatronum saccharophilum]
MKKSKDNLLHNKDFILLFLGGLISRLGNSIHYVALTWFVLDTTGSGAATGTILLLSNLPGIFIRPFGGVVADRISRKLLIVLMDVFRGIVILWLAWVVYSGAATLVHLGVATVLVAVGSAFFDPAVSATVPSLVADHNLEKANSIEHFSFSLTGVIGAALGGVLIAIFGVAGVFLINGVSYLVSAFSELFINIPKLKRKEEESFTFIEDFKFGIKYLFNDSDLRVIILGSIIINFIAAGTIAVGVPYIFTEVLKFDSKLFGVGQSIMPIGAVVGALLFNILPKAKNFHSLMVKTNLIMASAFIIMGVMIFPQVLNFYNLTFISIGILIFLFIFGISNTILHIPLHSFLQRLIPNELRGRIFALLGTFSQGLVPISMALVGFLIDIINPYVFLIVAGFSWIILILVASKKFDLSHLKTGGVEGR